MLSVKWNMRFLELARLIASWSRDPSTKCGAVIVRPDKTIASLGFNGFPRGMHDDVSLYDDRETKYSRILHAEDNALLSSFERLAGYGLYTWPLPPCDRCAVRIIQSGITYVMAPEITESLKDRWGDALKRTEAYFQEAGVQFQWV